MLANIHKHYVALLLIIGGFQSAQAQTWTLQQCIDTAQVHNKNLQMSRNNIAIGEQRFVTNAIIAKSAIMMMMALHCFFC